MKVIKLLVSILLVQSFLSDPAQAQQKQFRALIVTTTRGWHHESLHAGVLAIQELAKRNFFDAVLYEDPHGFTD